MEAASQGCDFWKWYIRDYLDERGRMRHPYYIPSQCYFYLTFHANGSDEDTLQLDRVGMNRGAEYPGGSGLGGHGSFRIIAEEGQSANRFLYLILQSVD